MKYIDADRLKAEIEKRLKNVRDYMNGMGMKYKGPKYYKAQGKESAYDALLNILDSLQQEQPNDVCAKIKEYYGEEPAFEDERTKAAYHFFSAGRAFELREYEEERGKHITDLLDNFQKGMNAGYEKAISELKEGKVECSPIMKELIDKLFNIGNVFNFGFGPKTIQQEQPEVDFEKEVRPIWENKKNRPVSFKEFVSIARRFWNKGYGARKTEAMITYEEYRKEKPVPANLEEAAKGYARAYTDNDNGNGGDDWEEDIKITFIAGAKWQKEQMMSEAVEAEVQYFGETQGVPRTIKIPRMQEWLRPFKDGDKVRIIIVKEDSHDT